MMKVVRKTRGISKHLTYLQVGEEYWLGILAAPHGVALNELGFSTPLVAGENLLPSAGGGIACRRNAEGDLIIHRNQPKETAFRQAEWHWKEFRGRYDTVDRQKIVEVPYQRYPRTEILPYGLDLHVRANDVGELFVIAGPFLMSSDNVAQATNTMNMFIELFGECIILRPDMSTWQRAPLRQLNWELLPPGKNPWASAKPALERVVSKAEKGNQPVIRARFEAIGQHEPEFVAVGDHGFDGYVVFGFPRLNFCVLECRSVNNATYVLNENSWEVVSMLSKAEILSAKIQRERFIHREGWFKSIAELLSTRPSKIAA